MVHITKEDVEEYRRKMARGRVKNPIVVPKIPLSKPVEPPPAPVEPVALLPAWASWCVPPISKAKKDETRRQTQEQIRRGKIPRRPCCICGNPRAEAHHPDYHYPMEVVWLCRWHHFEAHLYYGERQGKNTAFFRNYLKKYPRPPYPNGFEI